MKGTVQNGWGMATWSPSWTQEDYNRQLILEIDALRAEIVRLQALCAQVRDEMWSMPGTEFGRQIVKATIDAEDVR